MVDGVGQEIPVATLLKQIGEHPFITVHQLSRILGVSRSQVYDELDGLRAEGWVKSVNPRHPDIRARSLYYLTPAGEARLSLPRRRGSPRFLERIATVYEVRNLFISARCAGLPIAQWQVLTPHVRGVSLHGAALTPDGRRLIVEWDRGERPIRLYRHRLRRVAAIAARRGAGLLLVAADDARGAGLLSILSDYLNPRGPHLGLTTRGFIAMQGIPAAVCYAPAILDFVSLGGFVETLPEPWGEELPLSPGVMSFRPGKWRKNERLCLELSPLQKVALRILAGLPLLTAEDLAVLAGRKNGEWVRRLLADLRDRGLVGEYVDDPNSLDRYYFPTRAGVAFLAAACGAPAHAYARARGWRINDGEVSVSRLVRVFQHTREAREVALALAREASPRHQTITWYDEIEAYVHFTMGGQRRVLAPDARIHWAGRVIFVEIDRGSGSLGRIAGKVRTYYDFRSCAEHRRFGERFRLLVVVPHPYRERQWLALVSRVARERKAAPLDVLVTTREELLRRGMNAPIWQGPGSGKKVHFAVGLSWQKE